jgi:hypothetical protein
MQKSLIIILFISFVICRNAISYDECFQGNCYSHSNPGWIVQGGSGCIKTGLTWKKKYNTNDELKKNHTYFYLAINNTDSKICNTPSVLKMKKLYFHSSDGKLEAFKALISKAINWCWIATNNKVKFSGKDIDDPFVTDNNIEVNLYLFSDGTIEKTFVRLESKNKYSGKDFQWMHFNRQNLTRLKNEISVLERSLRN